MNSWIDAGPTEVRVQGRLIRIARVRGDGYMFWNDPEAVLSGIRKSGVRVDLFTFVQRVSETSPKYSFHMEWDNFAALRIASFEDWWDKQIGFKARNKAKQAEKKGVVIREVSFTSSLVEGIHQIYNETPVRQGGPNRHYGKSVQTVYEQTATLIDNSIFIGAYLDESLIGFVRLVVDQTRTQAGVMEIATMIRHRDKAVANALVAQAVRVCAEREIPYLVYARFAYGKKQTSSLSDFKERNAFQKIEVPRYYIPLTRMGEVALRFKLHHPLADHLPESMISKIREMRASWYNRKLPLLAQTASQEKS